MKRGLMNARALYLEAIRDGDYERAIHEYSGDRYTQHSTPVKDGPEGFIQFFADFVERNPVREIEIVRSFQDGQYVFLHVLQNLNDGEFLYVTADIFDTDEHGRLIEHWDMIAEMTPVSAGQPTQLDGPTEPTDLDQTDRNKDVVSRYLGEALGPGGDRSGTDDFVDGARLIEHSPAREWATDVYVQVHNVIGSGSFVAAMSQIDRRGVETAVIDLFRLDAGRIVEHWDVMEEITPADTWVNSGKF